MMPSDHSLHWIFQEFHVGWIMVGIIAYASCFLTFRKPARAFSSPAFLALLLILVLGGKQELSLRTGEHRAVIFSRAVISNAGWTGLPPAESLMIQQSGHEVMKDFSVAALAEQFGIRILTAYMALLSGLLFLLYRDVRSCRSRPTRLIGALLFSLIAGQTMVHLSVNLGWLPIKSVPLPFVLWSPGNSLCLYGLLLLWLRVSYCGILQTNTAPSD